MRMVFISCRALGLKPHAEVAPDAWLEVLPSALNTCAVLMCDRGLEVSERALNTYVALHRLVSTYSWGLLRALQGCGVRIGRQSTWGIEAATSTLQRMPQPCLPLHAEALPLHCLPLPP